MMEFVWSRVALIMCGIILLGAVAVPLSGVLDGKNEEDLSELAEKDAELIDALIASDFDEKYVEGTDLMPSAGYAVRVAGYVLTVEDSEGNTGTAYLKKQMDALEITYGDRVLVEEIKEVELTEDVKEAEEVKEEKEENTQKVVTVYYDDTPGTIKVTCGPSPQK